MPLLCKNWPVTFVDSFSTFSSSHKGFLSVATLHTYGGSLAEITNQRFSLKYQTFRQLAAAFISGASCRNVWVFQRNSLIGEFRKRTLSDVTQPEFLQHYTLTLKVRTCARYRGIYVQMYVEQQCESAHTR